jgi:hypothetical protein
MVTIAIEFGELPAPKGEPLMDASAPEVESITGVPDGLFASPGVSSYKFSREHSRANTVKIDSSES